MRLWLLTLTVAGLAGVSVGSDYSKALWNEMNCVRGEVVDAVCCPDTHCENLKTETECGRALTCLWDDSDSSCKLNRDSAQNVCCQGSVNSLCSSVARGHCPDDFQVASGCCKDENLKWDSSLSVNRTGFVCCNTPCSDAKEKGCEVPPRCHQRSGGYDIRGLGFRPGLLDSYFSGPYSPSIGSVIPGLGRGYGPNYYYGGDYFGGPFPGKSIHDKDESKGYHVDEITVDDLMSSLVEALSADEDVFTYDDQTESDPLFGKIRYGGYNNKFNFLDPEFFLDWIYGSPLTYDYGYWDYFGNGGPYGFAAGYTDPYSGTFGYNTHGGYGVSSLPGSTGYSPYGGKYASSYESKSSY